jgi:hypothetical protein
MYDANALPPSNELPSELGTCHEVILIQSDAIRDLSSERDSLKKELEQLNAMLKKLLAGNRPEKFINPNQYLLAFPDDPELQAALEAAKRQSEQEIETITYTRAKRSKSQGTRDESFPAHLERVEILVEIPAQQQQLLEAGTLVLIGREPREVLVHEPARIYVKRFMEPIFAQGRSKLLADDAADREDARSACQG